MLLKLMRISSGRRLKMQEIEKLRKQIDSADQKLISILSKRMYVSKKVGLLKKKTKSNVLDSKREKIVLDKISRMSKNKLSSKFAINIYKLILAESKRLQK